jgi:hypothetical protein
MKNEFLMKDITDLLGIRMSSLQPWMDRGYVSPSIEKAQGPGTRNIWSRKDIFRLAAFKALLDNGFCREEAAVLVNSHTVLQLWGGAPKVREEDVLDPAWSDVIDVKVYAVRLVDEEGGTHNLLVEASSIFEELPMVGKYLGIKNFKRVYAVNITEAQRIAAG